jgi:hypothetical protein
MANFSGIAWRDQPTDTYEAARVLFVPVKIKALTWNLEHCGADIVEFAGVY